MFGKRIENIEEIRAYIKIHKTKVILLDSGKFIGPITFLMRQFVGEERNFILAQSLFKMLQKIRTTGNCNRQD